jgi:hypothetical protein
MTYNEYHTTYTNKAKSYSINACRRALEDCYATMTMWNAELSAEYSTRLWAEIDAMRERIAYLQRKH